LRILAAFLPTLAVEKNAGILRNVLIEFGSPTRARTWNLWMLFLEALDNNAIVQGTPFHGCTPSDDVY
jgi:hypothetical protein